MLRVVLITGISGSGKSVALRMLEDTGYTCIDNLPVRFLSEVIASARDDELARIAIAIDVRSPGELAELPDVVTAQRAMGTSLRVIFLDANTQTLVQRYSESRRRHPLTDRLSRHGQAPSLLDAIALERDLLAPLREQEHVIDTSDLTPGQLRAWISDLIQDDRPPLVLTFESFAFKRGVPNDADLVFDARCLPNPYYDRNLRPLTGRDEAVATWLASFDVVNQMIDDITDYLRRWLPRYTQDTRSYLTVAVGCTGGQHRSVYVVEQLAKRFADHDPLLIRHRAQLPKEHA
ncbi:MULTISPECIES: RNase adapter RapZ [unclassified Bordetella]|uniref:RNase adapter RapZ n=1 Tax=unclassified Bordetella TaxID=2630031 RepID=UPI001326957F|nr:MULTISPECIES: RNase adapter RapZ [unclassified Bordetella]MVW71977.1 RNase adapter RapZ [Bordetella sp. 15P40C-2]MVW79234.1 RNase adapter RapZ [Bordetella sp. 02P26C-1]